MKNLFLFSFATLLMLGGCTQDNLQPGSTAPTRETRFQTHFDHLKSLFAKSGQITQNMDANSRATCRRVVPICHKGNSILVNASAVPAHLSHGDQLTCCQTSCINGDLNRAIFTWYYDTDVNDCFDLILDGYDQVTMGYGDNAISVEAYTYGGTTEYNIYTYNQNTYTFLCTNFGATTAEYKCARAYLKSVIATNSCIPNFCDL